MKMYQTRDDCVEQELARLWHDHRSLNPARAREVLRETVCVRDRKYYIEPVVHVALQSLDAAALMDIVDRVGAGELVSRYRTVEGLRSSPAPLLTLEELANATDGLLVHIEQVREELLHWGRASKPFADCPYLDTLLGPLYPTEALFPLESKECDLNDMCTDEGGAVVSTGVEQPRRGLVGAAEIEEILGRRRQGWPFKERARSFRGLGTPDLTALSDLRHQALEAKMRVLDWASEILHAEDPAGEFEVRTDWREIFTDAFSPRELAFLLRIDAHLTGYDLLTGTRVSGFGENPGGVSAMFAFLEHVGCEVLVGPLSTVRGLLSHLMRPSVTARPPGYFEAVARGHGADMDDAIAEYEALSAQARRAGTKWVSTQRRWLKKAALDLDPAANERRRVGTRLFLPEQMILTLDGPEATVSWPGGKTSLKLDPALMRELMVFVTRQGSMYTPVSETKKRYLRRLRAELLRCLPLSDDPIRAFGDGDYELRIEAHMKT